LRCQIPVSDVGHHHVAGIEPGFERSTDAEYA
jgi:hypothetical protein